METNSFCWYIWKRSVTDRDFRVLHRDDLPSCGFRSVYAIDEQSAEALQQSQNYTSFRGVVYEEKLWIDADTAEAAKTIGEGLKELGLHYLLYTTGNRGAHFGISRYAQPSQLLPEQDKAWVKARFPEADLSLYTHLHMFRQIGNKHEKTGRPKELIEEVDGTAIVYGKPERKKPVATVNEVMNPWIMSIFNDQAVMNNTTPAVNGGRHKALVAIATRFAIRKESSQVAIWWMRETNKLFSEPKDETELQKILHWAYNERQKD